MGAGESTAHTLVFLKKVRVISLLSTVVVRLSCKQKVVSSILTGGMKRAIVTPHCGITIDRVGCDYRRVRKLDHPFGAIFFVLYWVLGVGIRPPLKPHRRGLEWL